MFSSATVTVSAVNAVELALGQRQQRVGLLLHNEK